MLDLALPLYAFHFMSVFRRFAPLLLWVATAAVVTALSLRFAMRALGVRDDIQFPGLIYSFTAPLVRPFYRFFPADERFAYHVLEAASLAAAGAALGVALAMYMLGLLALHAGSTRDTGEVRVDA